MINGKRIISLCISKPYDRGCLSLISSLSEALHKMNCHLFVYSTCSDLYWGYSSEKGEMSVFELIDYDVTDAVIIPSEKLADKNIREDIARKAEEHNIPVIYIGGSGESGISIRFDYETGFEKIARHIVEHHRSRRIHFMAGFKGNEFSEKRFEVLKNVMRENGLETPDDMISYGDFWSAPTERAVEKLISNRNIPEALICANDFMAITACDVLKRHGYKVPEDVIVTGMDGIDEIYFSTPQITSCKCSFEDLSDKIAGLIPDILSHKLTSGDFTVIPSIELSQSCGCSEGKQINISEYLNAMNNRMYKYQNDEHDYSRSTIKMQTAVSIENAALEISAAVDANMDLACQMCCLLIEERIDERSDLLRNDDWNGFGDRMCLFYDHDSSFKSKDDLAPKAFERKNIVPDLSEKLEREFPLIFAAINFLEKPLGYACFYFDNYDISNYARIPQAVDFLNTGVSGFINANHQRYLNTKIEKMYNSDVLTKLYNRNGFTREYEKFINSLKIGEKISVIAVDLDGLKLINDNYGHGEGDNAIFTVAEATRSVLPSEALSARFGGDEFVSIIKGEVDEKTLKAAYGRFFDEYNKTSGKPYKVYASIGVFITVADVKADDASGLEKLLKEADKKMYDEKIRRKKVGKA